MASAFGAPISGVLLVLEEGASFWDTDLILFSFFCGLSAKFFFFIFLQVRTRTRTRTTAPPYTHGD
jgi:chloride channel 7